MQGVAYGYINHSKIKEGYLKVRELSEYLQLHPDIKRNYPFYEERFKSLLFKLECRLLAEKINRDRIRIAKNQVIKGIINNQL